MFVAMAMPECAQWPCMPSGAGNAAGFGLGFAVRRAALGCPARRQFTALLFAPADKRNNPGS